METSSQSVSPLDCFPNFDPVNDETPWDSPTLLNIVLAGPAGVGKTHLAAAMFTDHWECNGSTEFITATALIRKFREKVAKESVLLERYVDGKDDRADRLDGGCEVLIVDDIGAGANADRYASEIFCEILDRRMGADLCSIFTTNCTRVEMLEWLCERGYSRLLNRCKWVALDGDDRRLRDPRPLANLKDST
jgi:DNA replication protein DnaC